MYASNNWFIFKYKIHSVLKVVCSILNIYKSTISQRREKNVLFQMWKSTDCTFKGYFRNKYWGNSAWHSGTCERPEKVKTITGCCQCIHKFTMWRWTCTTQNQKLMHAEKINTSDTATTRIGKHSLFGLLSSHNKNTEFTD